MFMGNGNIEIVFNQSQRTIAPVHSVFFYSPAQILKKFMAGKYKEFLGSGIIC